MKIESKRVREQESKRTRDRRIGGFRLIPVSLYLLISVSLLSAAPSALAYMYQGQSAFPDSYPSCPTPCQAACGSNQKMNFAGYCVSVGSFCCEEAPKNSCMGSCVPADACEPGANPGGECTGGLVCCGVLKKTGPATATTTGQSQGGQAQQSGETQVSVEGKACTTPAGVSFPCPLGTGTAENISSLVGQIIRWALGLIGALFFAMFVWGGVLYMTAGSSKRTDEGQKTLVNAVIGMAVVLCSYLIVDWVLKMIGVALGG